MTQNMDIHPSEDRLLDLVHGLLAADDTQAVIEHIGECSECERRFRLLVRDREEALARPMPKIIDGRIVVPTPLPRRRRARIVAGAALAAALALAVVIPSALRERANNTATYWLPVEHSQVLFRSNPTDLPTPRAEDTSSRLDDALAAYVARDAERARKLFAATDGLTGGAETRRQIFLASAMVLTGDAATAIDVLETIGMETLPAPWRQRAQWIHFEALRVDGRDDEAGRVLEQLVEDPGEFADRVARE